MKYFLLTFTILSTLTVTGQEISNFVLVGPNGITEDPKQALSFIVIKRFDNHFERLDYKMHGPLVKSRSYKDSSLTMLHGNYYEYAPGGILLYAGKYKDNLKSGDWMTFNDTGKVVKWEKYDNDTLVRVVTVDKRDSAKVYPDEKESEFPGGVKGWVKYLRKSLEESDATSKSPGGGKVVIGFMVGADGVVQEVFVGKSVDFFLDDAATDIIRKSPKWNAAWQNGHWVKSYKMQPITFGPAQ